MQTGTYYQLFPVLFGSGTLEQVGQKAKELGMTKVMVITDEGIAALGYPQKVVEYIKAAGLQVELWDKALPNAPCDSVIAAAALARELGIDGLVGIGGGSSIDTAKALGTIILNGDNVLDDIMAYIVGEKQFEFAPLPVITIPTTAGTGSEVTRMAVLDDPIHKLKIGLPAQGALAIVDPTMALGSPAGLTAACGMDAFGHASESFTGIGCTAHTEMLACEAIRNIVKWLPVAVEDKNNLEAREHMAFAANIAGIAFNEDNCHVGHSVGQVCGQNYHQAHGLTIAWTTPGAIEFAADDHPGKIRTLGQAMGLDLEGVDDANVGVVVADAVRAFMKRIGIPSLADRGIDHDGFMAGIDEAMTHELTAYYDGEVTRERLEKMMERTYIWDQL